MTQKPETNIPAMAADTIGRDLLIAMVLELKLLPKPWPAMSQDQQNDVIDRMRKRVVTAVRTAVHLMASEGRTTIVAELEQVTVKDGIKAVLTMSKSDPNRHGLMDAQGKTVLIAIADAEEHMGDVAAVRGEPDQRGMDLGREYDPNGDGKGMDNGQPGDVVDAEYREVPALGNDPLQAELDRAYQAGRTAAANGDPKDAAPLARHQFVARWTQGWVDWHDENDDPSASTGDGGAADEGTSTDGDAPESTDASTNPEAGAAWPSPRRVAPGVKYRDPATGQTWTGRGMKPKWLADALAAGKSLADFEVGGDDKKAA